MSEELTELQEHAEHAKGNAKLAPVSVTMAILAVLVAVASLLGHRSHTEEVVLQAKSSDQWAYYQAKTYAATLTNSSLTSPLCRQLPMRQLWQSSATNIPAKPGAIKT